MWKIPTHQGLALLPRSLSEAGAEAAQVCKPALPQALLCQEYQSAQIHQYQWPGPGGQEARSLLGEPRLLPGLRQEKASSPQPWADPPPPLPTCGCSLCPSSRCCSWLCKTVGTCSVKEKCQAGSSGRWKLMGGIAWCPADLICFQQWQPAWKLQPVKPNFLCQSDQATALFSVSSLVAPKQKDGAKTSRSAAYQLCNLAHILLLRPPFSQGQWV